MVFAVSQYVPIDIDKEPFEDPALETELRGLLDELGGPSIFDDPAYCFAPRMITMRRTDRPNTIHFELTGEYISGGGVDPETGAADFDTDFKTIEFLWDKSAETLFSETHWREPRWKSLERWIRRGAAQLQGHGLQPRSLQRNLREYARMNPGAAAALARELDISNLLPEQQS